MKVLTFCFILAVAQHFADQETPQQNQASQQGASPNRAANASTGLSGEATKKETLGPSQYRPGIGTIIVAELSNALDAKKAKVGDRVECSVSQDLLFQGKIIIPRNAKVIGHVTEAEALNKETHQSRLGLTFEKIQLKDKKELLFQAPAIVVALAPPAKQIIKTATDIRDMPVQMQNGGSSPGMGSSTGGSIMGSIASNADLIGANMPSTSGTISASNRGVISWPGVYLLKGPPGSSIIASPKGNVLLEFQSQMVLRITEPGN